MKYYLLGLCLLVMSLFSAQQKPPYWNEIQSFKTNASLETLPKGAILMIGSSSFTNWQDVGTYFPAKKFINRGFGGSRLVDLNTYSKELLEVPTPTQIWIYCGENDIAYTEDPASPSDVLKRFKTLYNTVRATFPQAKIDYLSIKRSESREMLWPEMQKANEKIKRFLNKKDNARYIDVTHALENAQGALRTELFLEDKLHLNADGYTVWAQVLRPYLN